MPTFPTIVVNPIAPQALVMVCTPSDALKDMTKVTASVIWIKKPDGTVLVLNTSGTVATGVLTLTHPFALGDIDQVGIYKVRPVHTLLGGLTIKGSIQRFQVIADDGL